MLPRLLAEQIIYVKKVASLLAEVREVEEPSLGKNSGRQRLDPSAEEKLQRASEAEAMHSRGETLKTLSAGRKQRNRLAATAKPFKNSDSGQQRAFLVQF